MSPIAIVTGFTFSLALSMGLVPILLMLAKSFSLYDQPNNGEVGALRRRIHATPIPRLGGIAIVCAFFATFVVAHPSFEFYGAISLSVLIFILGMFDDLRPIAARIRLLLQILICGTTVFAGNLIVEDIFITQSLSIHLHQVVGFCLSTFIMVGAINALNMVDGLDGLAGGISIITFLLLSYLFFLTTNNAEFVLYVAIPAIGAILGFLRYNTHPASIFMGDNGSNWLGFMVGLFMLIILTNHTPTIAADGTFSRIRTPAISVLLCFAIPICDTLSVIFARLKNGFHPMQADNRHFHHTLLRIGLTQTESVILIYFISLVAGILGLTPLMYPQHNLDLAPLLGLIIVFTLISLPIVLNNRSRIRTVVDTFREYQALKQRSTWLNRSLSIWERVNKYCMFLILVLTPTFAGQIPEKFGYMAIPVLILLLISFLVKLRSNDFIESLVITLGSIVLLAAINHNVLKVEILGQKYEIQTIYNGLFVFLFVSSILFTIVSLRKKYLHLTPSDFLVIVLPVLLLLLPETLQEEFRLEVISLRSIVIFVAYRTLEKRRLHARRHIKMATTIALFYVIMVSILGMKIIY